MAIVWQGQPPARLRGTMSAFFLVGSLVSIGLLTVAGAVTPAVLAAVLGLSPAVVAGFVLSRWVNRLLDAARLRLLALTASAGGALLLTPGFITDVAGFALLIPPTRDVVRAQRRLQPKSLAQVAAQLE